jgi:hypothetical protein
MVFDMRLRESGGATAVRLRRDRRKEAWQFTLAVTQPKSHLETQSRRP